MKSIWSKYEQNAEKFFVRITHKRLLDGKDERTCWLTDLKSLYSETLSTNADVMERAQNENPLLLVSLLEEKILQTISTPPTTISTADTEQITFDRDANRLQLKYNLSETIALKFYWTLSKCDEIAFFEMITMPLLRQIVHAEEVTRNLVEIVKHKDLEIEQYKLDGAPPLLRRQFVTERFNANKMKSLTKPLFDCSVSDLLPTVTDTMDALVDDDIINLNVSSGSRESETSNDAKVTQSDANSFIPARKMKRNRYDEDAKLPLKVEYVDSDDQNDDVNVSNSTVKFACSSDNNNDGNSSSSSSTKTSVDNKSDGDALSTKTSTKKIRNKLNL